MKVISKTVVSIEQVMIQYPSECRFFFVDTGNFSIFFLKGAPDLKMFSKPAVLGALARFVLSAYVAMVC